jgi:hypothetical protein
LRALSSGSNSAAPSAKIRWKRYWVGMPLELFHSTGSYDLEKEKNTILGVKVHSLDSRESFSFFHSFNFSARRRSQISIRSSIDNLSLKIYPNRNLLHSEPLVPCELLGLERAL